MSENRESLLQALVRARENLAKATAQVLELEATLSLDQPPTIVQIKDEQVQRILNNMIEGFQIISFDWRYLYLNDSAARYGRQKKEDLLGHTVMEKYPGIETTDMFALMQRCMQERTGQDAEFEFTYPDGNQAWFEFRIRPIEEGICILTLDITERKLDDDHLRHSEQRYRDLIEQAADGIFVTDQHGVYLSVNNAAARMLGYSPQELVGLNRTITYVADDLHNIPHRTQALQDGKALLYERNVRRKDGTVFPAELNTRMLSDGSFQAIMRDITERKQAAEALRQSELRYRELMEQASDGIIVSTPQHVLMDVNPRMCELLGYTRDELLKLTTKDYVLAEDLAQNPVRIEEILSGRTVISERRFVRKDGSLFWAEVSAKLLTSGNILAIVRDITERKNTENHIRKLYRTLSVLSDVNQSIVRVRHLPTLFQRVCRIAVENGAFRMAWIGLIDPLTSAVTVAASAGNIGDYLEKTQINLNDETRMQDPTGLSLRLGERVVCNNIAEDPRMTPWREDALRLGYRSSVALPLMVNREVRGALNLYADTIDFFDDEEFRLIEEMAMDISFAMEFAEQEAKRHQALAALQKSQALLAETGRMAQVGGWEIAVKTLNLIWTESVYHIHEVDLSYRPTVEEAIRFYAPTSRHIIEQAVQRAIEFGEPFDVTLEIITAKGNRRWVHAIGRVSEENGKTIWGTFQDITARKRAEDTLLDLNRIYRTLSDSNQALVRATTVESLLHSVCNVIVQVGAYAAAWVETPDKTQTTKRGLAILPAFKDEKFVEEQIVSQQAYTEGIRQIRLNHPDSAQHDWQHAAFQRGLLAFVSLPIAADGGVLGTLNIYSTSPLSFSDTEIRLLDELSGDIGYGIKSLRAHERVQQSEERFRVIIDRSPDVILMLDPTTGHIMQVNNAVQRILGYDVSTITGQPFSILFPAKPHQGEALLNIIRAGENILETGYMDRLDGTSCPIEFSATQFQWDGTTAILMILRDISERMQLEEERLRAEILHVEIQKEREVLDLKERFISMVSHEFRTPLSVIMSSTEIMQGYRERLSIERQTAHLAKIRDHAQFMAAMLDDVLTVSKARAGKIAFLPSFFVLEDFCRNLVEQIQLTAGKEHRIVLNIRDSFGEVFMDPKLIQHILLNLLSNAAKYSPTGTTITLTLSREAEKMVLEVRDEGIGIPKSDHAHLFEPFHRAKNTGTTQGTGLGLTIVKDSVDLHGGHITFESTEGVGTVFTVKFPNITGKMQ